jgi:hypothetical protein
MIYWPTLAFSSGIDLNIECQTQGFVCLSACSPHALRQVRVFSAHGASVSKYLSPLSNRSPRRSQSSKLQLLGSMLRDGLCPADLPRVVARHRYRSAHLVHTAVPHMSSLHHNCTQHPVQRQRYMPLANLRHISPAPDFNWNLERKQLLLS